MATIDNERHIRYMLLLHEGGILVLREILRIETTKAGNPLGNILSANEAVLKRKMDKQTYSNVFGSSGNQDVNTWDISLLATMILHLFENSVPGDIKKCIRDLKDLRNNVAHSPSMSLSSEEYENNRKNLAAILMKMCVGVDRMVYDKCQNLIKDVAVGPIDIRSALERVEEFKKCDKVIQTLLESYLQKMEEISIKVDAVSNEMEGNSIKMADISNKVEVISAEMNDVSTKVEDVTAKVDDVATKMNDVSTIHAIVEGNSATLQRIFSTVEELKDVAKEVSSVANETIEDTDNDNCGTRNKEINAERGGGSQVCYGARNSNASTKDVEFQAAKGNSSLTVSETFSEISSDIEANLRKYRHEFEKRIKDPSILSHLVGQSVISEEFSSRITDLYVVGETIKASKELLVAVMNSKEPGKWQSFVESIDRADYPYLKQLLLSPTAYDSLSSTRAQRNIRLYKSILENSICAVDILPELRQRRVLNNIDIEVILKTYETKGHTYSTMILLDRMQCRMSPQEWYYEFLDLLMEINPLIVQKMEPDFIDNPSAFKPKLGTPISNKKEDTMVSQRKEFDEEQSAYGSLHEHFVEDRGEGYEDTNDLGAPSLPTMRQDSPLTSTGYHIDSLQTNLKELNIKPDMTKSLSIGILQRESSKPGKTDEQKADVDNREEEDEDDDEEEEDSMGSDYDNTEVEAAALASHTAAPLKLREYQLELAENAVLGRNTIICAETGSGKTWVALHIVQQHLQNARNGQKKVVFMARTGALIKQQSDRFKTCLPQFQTRLITGEDDQSRMLNMFLENYDILCFTPQILVNNLEDNVIKSLSEFSLLILDECHHTRGDGPYSTLMRKYLVEKSKTKKEMPQVVGLTASIGVGKSRTDQESVDYILRVCSCLDVRIISTVERNFKELKKHVSIPDEETIQLVKQKDDPCKHFILTAMEETEDMLQDNSLMQPDMIDLMDTQPRDRESQEYNKWTVDVMRAALLKVDDYDVSRDISSCAKYLNIYNSALEVNKLLLSRDVIKYLAEKHRLEGENKDKLTEMEKELFKNLQNVQKTINVKGKNTENPNVRILSDTLRKMLDDKGDDSRAMVFVKARATCRSLAAFLDRDLQSSGVKASPLYGKENRGGDDGMTESQQTEILDKFRSGFFKVLVCTSVGNEGIDVPDCNIVLSYEYSGDEITKIQMKGRARKKKATTITMGSDKVVEQEMINTYKAAMMYRAMNTVKQFDPKFINMKVNAFQSEETHKYRFKAEVEKLKKGRKSDEDYAILCGRCNTFACYVSDVRQLGHDHIVIDKDFADKITRKEHKKPKTYDGLHKKYKMYCKKCPIDWGIIGLRDGLDCMILKIINFKFRNLRTHGVSTYKKWIDVPCAVPEIKLEDLSRLLGPEET